MILVKHIHITNSCENHATSDALCFERGMYMEIYFFKSDLIEPKFVDFPDARTICRKQVTETVFRVNATVYQKGRFWRPKT